MHSRPLVVSALLVALSALPHGANAADFIFGDDFTSAANCTGLPTPSVAIVASPSARTTTLATQMRYLVKLRSCGYDGDVTLGASGQPASWSTTLDPPASTLAANGVATAALIVDVPSNGDAGQFAIDVAAQAGSYTGHGSAGLDVVNQLIITILDGTGSGQHPFPPFMTIKSGAMIRFVDQDTTTAHRIHSDGGTGFMHQSSDMGAGQEFDVVPTDVGANKYFFYCHDHGEATGNTHLSVE